MTPRQDAGFIGIEALVAFAILVLALTALYQALSSSYHLAARTSLQEQTLEEARSLLETLSGDGNVEAGLQRGRFASGARWRLLVTQVEGNGSGDDKTRVNRFWVDLRAVDARGGELVHLKTIVLSAAGE